MFTQPCFIRKNTPELRKMLLEFGYKPFGSVKYEWDTGCGLSTDNRLGEFESFDNNGLKNIIKCGPPDYENSIDCGTNEELFLALAALRDDTPINSYYWFNDNLFKCEGLEIDRVLKNNTANYLLKCRHVDNSMIISCFKERNMIKATVKEIIEHFK